MPVTTAVATEPMKKRPQESLTLPLFPEAPVTSLCVVPMAQTPLREDQKTFNALIRKITSKRQRLSAWDAAQSRFRREFATTLLPLQQQEAELRIRLAETLDACWAGKGMTQRERRTLSALIVDLAQEILEHGEHAGMKILYNRHSQSDFDAEEAARRDGMKAVLEEMFGVELGGDVDMGSPEDILAHLESQRRAHKEQARARKGGRRKSAKEQAGAQRREAEEKRLGQSIQAVYRKLASALHPDREPDPGERGRKTALMQRANEAYAKDDLLELLELQLALEQIDGSHLTAIEPQLLTSYITILKNQLSELDRALSRTQNEFAAQFGLPPFGRIGPKDLTALLATSVTACGVSIRELEGHLAAASDPARLKAWLKTLSRRPPPPAMGDFPF